MDAHERFLAFEAVLNYCKDRTIDGSLNEAVEYGREVGLMDGCNSLTPSGQRLASTILSTIAQTAQSTVVKGYEKVQS